MRPLSGSRAAEPARQDSRWVVLVGRVGSAFARVNDREYAARYCKTDRRRIRFDANTQSDYKENKTNRDHTRRR